MVCRRQRNFLSLLESAFNPGFGYILQILKGLIRRITIRKATRKFQNLG